MSDNVKANLDMNLAKNFKFIEKGAVAGTDVLDEDSTFIDTRMIMLSRDTDFRGLDWYINYLDSAAFFARKNPKAYPTYLLQLGFIPVVYMPSCAGTIGAKLMTAFDSTGIPYIRMKATSFVVPYYQSDAVDAWASKFHLADYFGIKPEDVRAVDTARRLFANG